MSFRIALTVLVAATLISCALSRNTKCKRDQKLVNGRCAGPCSKVCKLPPCNGSVKVWDMQASRACWQDDIDSSGNTFRRNSCQCVIPENILSQEIPPLSNCMIKAIRNSGPGNLNIGSLDNVAIRRVQSPNNDVHFEGAVADSRICELLAKDDIEFKDNSRNSFFGRLEGGDDLIIFKEFTNNEVRVLDVFDAIEPKKGAILKNNRFKHITAKRCNIATSPAATITGNKCVTATINNPSACGYVDAGFSCSF